MNESIKVVFVFYFMKLKFYCSRVKYLVEKRFYTKNGKGS
jgi:hypothetical protein